MLLRILICLPVFFSCTSVLSQEKSLQAFKTASPPKLDGDLSDAVWSGMPVATDLVQNYPATGIPASQKTSIKVIYDNSAIYVGAYLYDNPLLIRRQIT